MDNCKSAAGNLLAELKVRHTKGYLEDSIMAHPNHPSLLCISDTLERYSVQCLAVRVDGDRLWELPLPCIVQFSDNGGMFHVLTAFSDNAAGYLDGKGSPVNISKEVFMKKSEGACLWRDVGVINHFPTSFLGTDERFKEYNIKGTGINRKYIKWPKNQVLGPDDTFSRNVVTNLG